MDKKILEICHIICLWNRRDITDFEAFRKIESILREEWTQIWDKEDWGSKSKNFK